MSLYHPLLYRPATIVPSNQILHRNDNSGSVTGDTMQKILEITIQKLPESPLTLRTYFEIRSATSGISACGQIWKNGTEYGTLRVQYDGEWKAFTEDLEFSEGDKVQLYIRSATTDGTAEGRNLRLLGTYKPKPLQPALFVTTMP